MPHPVEPDTATLRLPIAARVAAAHMPDASRTADDEVAWGFPALDPVIADAVAHAFGLRIRLDASGPSPLAHPAFAALYASARAEQVIRALSARTNLVLAGTTGVVVGSGPVADRLTGALGRIGMRVVRATDDPLTALRARLGGLDTVALAAAGDLRAHYVFLTGEDSPQVAAADLTGVVVDASPAGDALQVAPGATPATRAGVRVDGGARVVAVPTPLPRDLRSSDGLAWRIADALVTLSLAVTRGDDGALARAALAEVSP